MLSGREKYTRVSGKVLWNENFLIFQALKLKSFLKASEMKHQSEPEKIIPHCHQRNCFIFCACLLIVFAPTKLTPEALRIVNNAENWKSHEAQKKRDEEKILIRFWANENRRMNAPIHVILFSSSSSDLCWYLWISNYICESGRYLSTTRARTL